MSDIDLIKNQEPRKAHPNSIKYMRNLSEQHDDTAMVACMPEQWKTLYHAVLNGSDNIAHKDVDIFITQLKKCPKRPVCGPDSNPNTTSIKDHMYQVPTPPAGTPREHWRPKALEDGIYRKPDGTIYRVYYNLKKTHLLAKKLVIVNPGDKELGIPAKVKWVYAGAASRFVNSDERMPYEEAKAFGALYGMCVFGHPLNDPVSIHLGIGPICGGRQFGEEFEFMVDQAKLELGMPVANPVSKVDDVADISDWDHYNDADAIQARLAEIDQELNATDNARSNDYNHWERGE